MSLNMDQVYDKMAKSIDSMESQTKDFMEKMDPNKTQDTLQLQQYMQKWSITTNLATNLMSTLKEGTKNVVSNIR